MRIDTYPIPEKNSNTVRPSSAVGNGLGPRVKEDEDTALECNILALFFSGLFPLSPVVGTTLFNVLSSCERIFPIPRGEVRSLIHANAVLRINNCIVYEKEGQVKH